ncbi:MAG: anti-sigma-factor antagonist [Bacteroidota bacterium]|nr:anti-sigma-factor antagonist [Bacteroidota bacterium]
MKSEIKNGVLVISFDANLLGAHIMGPFIDLIKSSLEEGNKKVLLNLSSVQFLDSTGLGMMLSGISKIRSAGGQMVLCNVPDQVKKLLKMTKLESTFNLQPDEAAALGLLAQH